MTLTDANILAIIEIAAYTPILLFVALVFFRAQLGDGLRIRASVATLCALRITGASLQLATIHSPENASLFKWSAILSSVGLSPLFLATIGVLCHLDKGLDKIYQHPLGLTVRMHHIFLEVATVISVALVIAGGVKGGQSLGTTGVFNIDAIFKAGVAVLIVTYAGFCDASTFTLVYRHCGPLKDFELFVALYASMPLILVRLIYACLTAFGHSKTFDITTGNTWARLGMTIVMKVLVVVMYLTGDFMSAMRRHRYASVDT